MIHNPIVTEDGENPVLQTNVCLNGSWYEVKGNKIIR